MHRLKHDPDAQHRDTKQPRVLGRSSDLACAVALGLSTDGLEASSKCYETDHSIIGARVTSKGNVTTPVSLQKGPIS